MIDIIKNSSIFLLIFIISRNSNSSCSILVPVCKMHLERTSLSNRNESSNEHSQLNQNKYRGSSYDTYELSTSILTGFLASPITFSRFEYVIVFPPFRVNLPSNYPRSGSWFRGIPTVKSFATESRVTDTP